MSARQWYIYALKDPSTDVIRYVGWALDVKRRVQAHLLKAAANKTHKDRWILKLRTEGITPSVEILETGTSDDKKQAERAWIFRLRALGYDLTNTTDGGDGALGFTQSAEARAKIAAAGTGRKRSPETQAKLSAALKSSEKHAAHMARLAELNRGKERSEETKAKLRLVSGHAWSEESRAKLSATNTGRKLSPERYAALAAARDSAETRAKRTATLTGRKLSEEARANIGAARRAAWKRDGGRRRTDGGGRKRNGGTVKP